MHHISLLHETYDQIIREQEPNFLRLYLNPHVARTCFCLDRYMHTTWAGPRRSIRHKSARREDCQTFLANGLEEALSGAIKLARYNRQTAGSHSTGMILDPVGRLDAFASAQLPGGERVQFLPGLRVVGENEFNTAPGTLCMESSGPEAKADVDTRRVNPLVLVAGADHLLEHHAEAIRQFVGRHAPLVITCIDRASLSALRRRTSGILHEIVPDIVVFDESFVDHAVPFGAFTASKALFACWNQPGKATFHSTTFQPNTISTLHFMRCLAQMDPEFYSRYAESLLEVSTDLNLRGKWFRRFYNVSLYRLIRATGFYAENVRADGSFVVVNGRPVFDAVSGVACSFRGHNPGTYADEMSALGTLPPREGLSERERSADAKLADEAELGRTLENLTGLGFFLPAVSGATAVENALKVALIAQFPKRHILALKAGFGGKTLLALSGTANPSYKVHIDPLYADVHYVDPFASDAEARIDVLLETHAFAVVQVELIQAVGGVRRVPESVIRHLDAGRKRWGYLLLVDEVQTGMYRTGPFVLSQTFDLTPDFLLLGKATSDMMFPFALTLYSAAVRDSLERRGSDVTDSIKQHYGYAQGYKTAINVLGLGEDMDMQRHVTASGRLVDELLSAGLAGSKIVREVRVFGLLIAIELNTACWPHRWLGKRLSSFYLLSLLRHEKFPVLAGFCQYEPNVLKITPALNASRDEIRQACATIVDVLGRPLHTVLAAGFRALIKPSAIGKTTHEHTNASALEPATR
jgi:acetylornithine/succinyldiaminopimelate/putrescine aminotransferase